MSTVRLPEVRLLALKIPAVRRLEPMLNCTMSSTMMHTMIHTMSRMTMRTEANTSALVLALDGPLARSHCDDACTYPCALPRECKEVTSGIGGRMATCAVGHLEGRSLRDGGEGLHPTEGRDQAQTREWPQQRATSHTPCWALRSSRSCTKAATSFRCGEWRHLTLVPGKLVRPPSQHAVPYLASPPDQPVSWKLASPDLIPSHLELQVPLYAEAPPCLLG